MLLAGILYFFKKILKMPNQYDRFFTYSQRTKQNKAKQNTKKSFSTKNKKEKNKTKLSGEKHGQSRRIGLGGVIRLIA